MLNSGELQSKMLKVDVITFLNNRSEKLDGFYFLQYNIQVYNYYIDRDEHETTLKDKDNSI